MRKWSTVALVLGVGLVGCAQDEGNTDEEVTAEIRDLREAEQSAPEEAARLQEELQAAEQRVVALQEELALARQGVTDDVRRERAELEQQLNEQERSVATEVREAERLAREHNRETQQAREALQRGADVTDVQGHVESGATVETRPSQVEGRRVERQIGVERTDIEGRQQREG